MEINYRMRIVDTGETRYFDRVDEAKRAYVSRFGRMRGKWGKATIPGAERVVWEKADDEGELYAVIWHHRDDALVRDCFSFQIA